MEWKRWTVPVHQNALGLCNAPDTFMRVTDKAFGDLNFQFLFAYLDDILVFGSTFEETLFRLETVLSQLSNLNLKVSLRNVSCSVRKSVIWVMQLHMRSPPLILKRCERSQSDQDP